MAAALKITFTDGDVTTTEDSELLYWVNAFHAAKGEALRARYKQCVESNIQAQYGCAAESWVVIQVQAAPQQKTSQLFRLLQWI